MNLLIKGILLISVKRNGITAGGSFIFGTISRGWICHHIGCDWLFKLAINNHIIRDIIQFAESSDNMYRWLHFPILILDVHLAGNLED